MGADWRQSSPLTTHPIDLDHDLLRVDGQFDQPNRIRQVDIMSFIICLVAGRLLGWIA